ncbi:MAG: LuxR C-terminal-related transcriptional regulator [bacterium]|nr:PAS domain-containing protein [Phycisphaerales bacterium]MCE2653673.1 helix-turn-helix transcriptional regulator [Planctomycetaceae bacterium]
MANWKTIADADALWQSLTEDVHLPVWIVSPEGRVEFANHHSSSLVGKQPGELLGHSVTELFPAEVGRERVELVRRVADTGRPLMLYELVRGRWTRTVLRRISGAGATPAMVIMIQHPGTKREAAAETTEQRYDIIYPNSHDAGPLATLSRRELEVLTLIGEGLTTREIADRLHRTGKTVEWHRASLGRKLRVANRVELAQIAIAAGLSSANWSELSQAALGKAAEDNDIEPPVNGIGPG